MTKQIDACKFCEIIHSTKDSFIINEDNDVLAFLDNRPVFHGHTLVVPKEHFETLYDLPTALLTHLFEKVKSIGKAVEKGMEAQGSFIACNNIVSQSIPHIHVHIIPRNFKDGLRGFFWPRNKYTDQKQMADTQMKIRACLKATNANA